MIEGLGHTLPTARDARLAEEVLRHTATATPPVRRDRATHRFGVTRGGSHTEPERGQRRAAPNIASVAGPATSPGPKARADVVVRPVVVPGRTQTAPLSLFSAGAPTARSG